MLRTFQDVFLFAKDSATTLSTWQAGSTRHLKTKAAAPISPEMAAAVPSPKERSPSLPAQQD